MGRQCVLAGTVCEGEMTIMVCRLRGNYAELSECCREGGAFLGLLWDVSTTPPTQRISLCV